MVDLTENVFADRKIKVFRPAHVADRTRVQSGFFTVHSLSDKSSSPMESDERYAGKLLKLRIPSSSFSKLRFALDQYGVNQSSLFPDIDGLCRHIEWLHSYLVDESSLRRVTSRRAWRIP